VSCVAKVKVTGQGHSSDHDMSIQQIVELHVFVTCICLSLIPVFFKLTGTT